MKEAKLDVPKTKPDKRFNKNRTKGRSAPLSEGHKVQPDPRHRSRVAGKATEPTPPRQNVAAKATKTARKKSKETR